MALIWQTVLAKLYGHFAGAQSARLGLLSLSHICAAAASSIVADLSGQLIQRLLGEHMRSLLLLGRLLRLLLLL